MMPTRALRCAVYTRKSTEEGLQQEFNTLQAQREAGEAWNNNYRWHRFGHRTADGCVTTVQLRLWKTRATGDKGFGEVARPLGVSLAVLPPYTHLISRARATTA